MRALGISVISMAMTAAVIGNAYYQKKQFYPSVVYITKSNSSMAVIYIQSLVLVLMLGKLMRKIFLGTLRAAEFEHLMERFWYALTETCLAFTVFRDDFNPKFVALFTVLLFLKSFHWLAEDRVDYMERSPVIGWLFHLRVASLLAVLGFFDYMMIAHAYHSTITKGATVQLVFGFEYAILITMVANTTIKYVLHAAELRSDTPWDNKAVFLLYTELIIGFIRVILYVLFVIIMVRIYTLPLFAFRPMYYTTSHFKKALNDVILSRRAIRNMNTLYPDATPEELALSDNICIICREDMVSNSKKLPCGHIFHTACLRSWFQRQQTCPTCRLNILRTPIVVTQPPQAQQQAQQQPQPQVQQQQPLQGQQQPGQGLLPNLPGQAVRNMINPGAENNTVAANLFINMLSPTNMATGVNGVATATGLMGNVGGTGGAVNPFAMPQFPFMMPYAIPPPPMPPALDTLTDDEVRAMEGNERQHVEERIKLLRNIQLLLDASVTLMHQYSAITARLPAMPVPAPVQVAGTSTSGNASTTTITATLSEHQQQPSTSGINNLLNKNLVKEDIVKIEDIGREDDLDKPSKLSNENATIVTTLYPDIDNNLPNINNNNSNNNDNNNTNSNNNINNNNINSNNNSKNNLLNDSSCSSSGTITVASAMATEESAIVGTTIITSSPAQSLTSVAGAAGTSNTTIISKEDELLQTNDDAAELRRRRLQKFVQYEKDMRD